jgi:hypothetical protein
MSSVLSSPDADSKSARGSGGREQLVESACEAEELAFEELYLDTAPLLRALARQRFKVPVEDVGSLVNDVFVVRGRSSAAKARLHVRRALIDRSVARYLDYCYRNRTTRQGQGARGVPAPEPSLPQPRRARSLRSAAASHPSRPADHPRRMLVSAPSATSGTT